ncbi:3120_t:CDS:2, partial [Racocetra fulgida]
HVDTQPENRFSSLVHDQQIVIVPEFTLESAFDPTKYFIFCGNVLGSPYGTASPVTINPETGNIYGPEFPLTTPRDDQPATGLAAARMSALLTYRSRDSFESRFGRTYQDLNKNATVNGFSFVKAKTPAEYALLLHNDGLRCNNVNGKSLKSRDQNGNNNIALKQANIQDNDNIEPLDNKEYNQENNNVHSTAAVPHLFSAQSYLRYQGDKFVKRFDANCYISLTRKMDAYDIAKDRGDLKESDGLFTISEQYELAEFIPNSEMVTIKSLDGHDGFLIEFDQMNRHILRFTRTHLSEIFEEESCESDGIEEEKLVATKNSLFGEAEVEFL